MSWFIQVSLNVELSRIAISRSQTLAGGSRLISSPSMFIATLLLLKLQSLVDHSERHENYLKMDAIFHEAMG